MRLHTGIHVPHMVEKFLGGTKPLRMSAQCTVWCPSAGELAPSKQAAGSLHDEAWAGRVGCSSFEDVGRDRHHWRKPKGQGHGCSGALEEEGVLSAHVEAED